MSTTAKQKAPKRANKKGAVSISSVSKTWQVTNSTNAPVVVIDAYLADPSSTDELYGRSLQLLSATDGQQSIKAGETKTVSLGEAHTDSDGNAVDYSLIIARADNLFPVKLIELADGDSFPDTTATTDDAERMKEAEAFQQAITAFPSSDMASAFANVLGTNDEGQIKAFFGAYPQYGSIGLDEVVAVQTYYNRYGFVWAGYATTQTFDIYTSADGTTKKNLGTVTITNGVKAPVNNLDAPAGFTTTYMDQNHRKTTLYYANGQFSENVASTTPKICLQGLFVLLSQLTGQGEDNRLVPVLYGVVNDAEIFGVSGDYPSANSMSLESTGNSSTPSFGTKDYFDSLGLYDWLKLAGMAVGVIAGVIVFALTARYIYRRVKKGSVPAPTPDEIARQKRTKAQDAIRRMDPESKRGLAVPDDLTRSIADVKQKAIDRMARENWYKTSDVLNKQTEMAQELLKYGNSGAMEKVVANAYGDAEILGDYPIDLSPHMPGLLDHMKANNTAITKRIGEKQKEMSKTEAETITAAKEAAEQLTNRVVENEKIKQELNEDEMPEIIDD